MFNKFFIGQNVERVESAPQLDPITGVELIVSDEVTFFSGSREGRVISANCPWATQQITDSALSRVKGVRYQPFTATGTLIDPAAEIGDAVTLKGVYAGVYNVDVNYTGLYAPDISAPEDEELDHEYTFETRANREYKREIKGLATQITTQAGLIEAKVSQVGGAEDGSFSYEMRPTFVEYKADGKSVLRLDAKGGKFSGDIEAENGYFHGKIYAGNIQSGGKAGTVSGSAITAGTVSGSQIAMRAVSGGQWGKIALSTVDTTNLLAAVNTSLGYADTAHNVLFGSTQCVNVNASGSISGNSVSARTTFRFKDYTCSWVQIGSTWVIGR